MAIASKNWPTIEGRVISSKSVKTYRSSGSYTSRYGWGEGYIYQLVVFYEYMVNRRLFTSRRVFSTDYYSHDLRNVREIVDDYPPGKRVLVYYCPGNPRIAVLRPGVKLRNIALLVVGFFFFGMGLHGILGGF